MHKEEAKIFEKLFQQVKADYDKGRKRDAGWSYSTTIHLSV